MEPVLDRYEQSPDPVLKEAVRAARERLAGAPGPTEPQVPAPVDIGMRVGAG
jgi:hypothetical protein